MPPKSPPPTSLPSPDELRSIALGKFKVHPMLERLTPVYEALQHLRDGNKADHREALDDHAADWAAFVADVKAHGVKEPIKFCLIKGVPTIVDGRHRWQAATAAGYSDIRAIGVSEEEGRNLMESSVIGRQHLTKSMRAYWAVVMHPQVALDAEKVQKTGKKAPPSALNAEGLAEKFGVSLRLIEQACELYRELDTSHTLRRKHEWRVRAGYGLGAILAGIAGGDSTEDKPKGRQPFNIVKPLASVRTFFEHYSKLGPEQRDVMLEQGQKTLSESGEDFLIFMNELVSGAVQRAAEALTDGEEGGAP